MKIYEFTLPELNRYREKCNFTPDELIYFNAKANNESNVSIAMKNFWSESKVSILARKVKGKMRRIDYFDKT